MASEADRKLGSHRAADYGDTSFYAKRVLEAAGIVIALGLSILLLWYMLHALLLVFAGILMGIFLRGASDWLERRAGLSQGWSLAAVVTSLVLITGLGFWLLVPGVAAQISELVEQLPRSLDQARDSLARNAWAQPIFQQLPEASKLMGSVGGLIGKAAGFLSTTFGAVTSLIVVLLFGLYLAADAEGYQRGVIRLIPIPARDRAREILHVLGLTLHWWLIGRFVDMALVGLLTWIGLWLLDVPLALTLALIAAILNFVPNIGPIVAAIPAILLGLGEGQALALYVALLYIGIQTVESYLITPLIQQRTVSLPPVLTFFAQVAMGILLGIPGLILATPMAAAILVLVKMIYVEDLLGDKIEAQGEE